MDPFETIKLNSKGYKDLAEKRTSSFPEISRALEIVKDFIIKKKLIVYGGFAIDANLKLAKTEGIYSEGAVPDFDFLSPNFFEDSNELADILFKAKLPNVSAINATHFSSRRVRVNFVSVADITYCPINIYEKIPYVLIPKSKNELGKKYAGLRILAPDYQRLDLHRAFCIPFANPPTEVILHRLNKDQKRFRLLDERYPISWKSNYAKFGETLREIEIPKKYLFQSCVSGILGYAFLFQFVESLAQSKIIEDSGFSDAIAECLAQTIRAEIEIAKDDIKLHAPSTLDPALITIMTDSFENFPSRIKFDADPVYLNRFLDNLRPRTLLLGNYEIFDQKGEILPCYNLQKSLRVVELIVKNKSKELEKEVEGGKDDVMFGTENISLALPNHILLYFLQKYFERGDEIYLALYRSTLSLVEAAEKIFLGLTENAKPKIAEDLFQYLPFFLPASTYGNFNWGIDYVSYVQDKKYFFAEVPPSLRPITRPPFGYYPENESEPPTFDISKSEIYQIDGLVRSEPFQPLSLEIDENEEKK